MGEDIKEKLIPRAIDWFTGEALQFEEVDEELEEGDFEDEDDDEDDDLSEDRDDEDESEEDVSCPKSSHYKYPLLTSTRTRTPNPSKKLLNASRVRSSLLRITYPKLLFADHRSVRHDKSHLTSSRSSWMVSDSSGFRVATYIGVFCMHVCCHFLKSLDHSNLLRAFRVGFPDCRQTS